MTGHCIVQDRKCRTAHGCIFSCNVINLRITKRIVIIDLIMIFHGEAVNSSDLDIGALLFFLGSNRLHDLIYIEGTENCIIISIYKSMFQVIDSFRICHISRADGNADIILSCIYNRCFLR